MVKVRYSILVFLALFSGCYCLFGVWKNYKCCCQKEFAFTCLRKYELIVRRDSAISPFGLVGRISSQSIALVMDLYRVSTRFNMRFQEWLLDRTLLIMKSVEGEALSSFWFVLRQETLVQLEFVSTNFQTKDFCLFTGGTFALYSLLCRHAKVSTIPNQHKTDEELTTYSRQTYEENSLAAKVKRWLEGHAYKKNCLLILVLIGTCTAIGDGILTPAISGIQNHRFMSK